MYGIFTYIWLIFYGKCRYIYHTWMVWVSLFIGGQKSPFITFVGAPPCGIFSRKSRLVKVDIVWDMIRWRTRFVWIIAGGDAGDIWRLADLWTQAVGVCDYQSPHPKKLEMTNLGRSQIFLDCGGAFVKWWWWRWWRWRWRWWWWWWWWWWWLVRCFPVWNE